MPVTERQIIPPKREQPNVRFDPDVVELLNQCCGFIESSKHYDV